ncbi:MAG: hypothetical protein SFX72_17380 [Isosphaeraceae bacterium]|nr:hypothetical protein [Isosphaeraceae bacterium]
MLKDQRWIRPFFSAMIAAASIIAGCDSNPEAPTAPSNIIVSDSDGPAPSPAAAKTDESPKPIE